MSFHKAHRLMFVCRTIGQAFVVLLPVQSVGVMGDCRTYENVSPVEMTVSFVVTLFRCAQFDV